MKKLLLIILLIFISGCSPIQEEIIYPQEEIVQEIKEPTIGYTHIRADGNRLVLGSMEISKAKLHEIELKEKPEWILAASKENTTIWAAVGNGLAEFFIVKDEIIKIGEQKIQRGTTPLLLANIPEILTYQNNLKTNPIITPAGITYIDERGSIIAGTKKLEYNPLPDARLLQDNSGNIIFLAEPTTEYKHSVLGDSFEAKKIIILDTNNLEAEAKTEITIQNGVVEGISPIWYDINQDGRRDIIVTVSNEFEGSKIQIYDDTGKLFAEGEPIGQGFRWRHQLAVAKFGPKFERELAVIKTPHIGGTVEFYQITTKGLEIVAQIQGYSSHRLSSRNLDSAVAGDFDNDGKDELAVPTQDQRSIGIIGRSPEGAIEEHKLDLNGRLSTNLAATEINGQMIFGLGTEDKKLKIWI